MTTSSDGKSESTRVRRVADRIREEITDMLLRGEVRDPRASGVLVSGVQVSGDLGVARVFLRALETDPASARQREIVAAMERAGGLVRRRLGRTLGLRRVPEVRFAWDDAADRGRRVEELLEEIRADDVRAQRARARGDEGGDE